MGMVLRRTNYGEADRILDVLTPEGRRSVMARGVRREKSKLAGGIELFGLSDVVLLEGKGDLATLTSARLIEFWRAILEDYDRLQFGYYALKEIGRASEMIAEKVWFEMLLQILRALNDRTIDLRLIQVWFYVRYSEALGNLLNLRMDAEDRPLSKETQYSYDTWEHSLRASLSGEIGADHIKFLRLALHADIAALHHIKGLERILPGCLNVMRAHTGM